MSELYHNGSIIFDRLLNDEQAKKIMGLFTDKQTDETVYLELYDQENSNAGRVSGIEFCDYMTGWSSIQNELDDLGDYCREQGIQIDPDSLVVYSGDEDGGWRFEKLDHYWMDREEIGVRNSSTGCLVSEILRRKQLDTILPYLPTEALRKELAARGEFMNEQMT